MSKCGVISGPYFPVFGLNTERYGVSLRIQSECRKIRKKNNSIFGHFSRSVIQLRGVFDDFAVEFALIFAKRLIWLFAI